MEWLTGGVMHKNVKALLSNIYKLQKTIGYNFNNIETLLMALTHSSFANENRNDGFESNERLEFLGDSVLSLVISENIFKKYENLSEGEMTKTRANIVCEASLMKCSLEIGLGEYLLLGKGEELSGGRKRASILSDAFEALIGAIYVDGGFESAKAFINSKMENLIIDSVRGAIFHDYKTQLQEIVQKSGEHTVSYKILNEKGPDHNKTFVSQVSINDMVVGTGEGKSKKEAEQNAAKAALQNYIDI